MSLNASEIEILVNVARNYVSLVDATTITLGDGGKGGLGGRTRNQIVNLINRWYGRKPLDQQFGDIADT